MKKQLFILVLFVYSLTVFAQDTTQQVIPGRKNSAEQQKKPYVILISADGFRYDYAEKYHAEHLLALANGGVKAKSMIPSFPSITFPNHYTMVTGLYPAHHGIVENVFYNRDLKKEYYYKGKAALDGSWYGGTPLWVLAEQQQMISASFYWVGSETPIKGVLPTYYYKYNNQVPIGDRIQTVVNWLKLSADKRPHFITFYLPQVDHEGHLHSPESPEVANAVHFIDSAVYALTQAVKNTGLNVNYIFVSDHGMTTADIAHPLSLPAATDTSKYLVSGSGLLVELYAKNLYDIKKTYEQLKKEADGYDVYLRVNTPLRLHYSKSDDWHHHIGDILLMPKWPKVFKLDKGPLSPGVHGYDPRAVKDMHATFLAWGPAFKSNLQISSFSNVEIYPLITQILGLDYSEKIDGTKHLANKVLLKK